jgi:dipeptidyl aminopeptidase/acylaminoacyl peptidase
VKGVRLPLLELAVLAGLALVGTTFALVAGPTVPVLDAVAGSWRHVGEQAAGLGWSPAAPPSSQVAYLQDGPWSRRFVRIDPDTLADLPGTSGLDLLPWWTASGDGTTLLTGESTGHPMAIVVRDLRTGAELARHRLPGDLGPPTLSRDGSRIFAVERERGVATRLRLFDTLSGRSIAAFPTGNDQGFWDSYWLSPDGARVAVYHQPDSDDAPRTPLVAVYDLLGGVEVGRVSVDGVLAGQWLTKRTVDGEPALLWAHWLPGVALSPDGQRLAIVHAERDYLTVVDTRRVAIERAVPLTRPTHILDLLLDLFRGRVASAKGPSEGVTRQARFSPDGRLVYVITTAKSPAMTRDGLATRRADTLEVIDAATGRLLAQALKGDWVSWVKPAVDGRSLYVLSQEQRGDAGDEVSAPRRWLLRRLDGRTLAVRAERELDDFRSLLILLQPQPRHQA